MTQRKRKRKAREWWCLEDSVDGEIYDMIYESKKQARFALKSQWWPTKTQLLHVREVLPKKRRAKK